ncbi:MAG: hypothetical protein WC482_03090 [Candidatus Omnitrophota bacterium]|jgi:Tfp pilus assembly protein PilV
MNMNLRSSRGFSLAEAVVSVSVLGMIWLAAVDAMIVGEYSASCARHRVQAAYIAQQAIENLRKIPYDIMASSGPTAVVIDSRGTPDNNNDNFNGIQTITVDAEAYGTYYKRVAVNIRWNEMFFGRVRQVSEYCITYIANEPQIN